MNQKIPFHQLSSRIAAATGISEDSAEIFVKNFFDILSDELIKGETVRIKGLGEFSLYDDGEGEEKSVRFTADKDLAETLNAPFAMFEPVTLNDEVTDSMLAVNEEEPENVEPQASEIITSGHEESVTPAEQIPETPVTENYGTNEQTEEEETPTPVIADECASNAPAETGNTPETKEETPVVEDSAPSVEKTEEPESQNETPVSIIEPLEEEPEVYVTSETKQPSEGNFWIGLIIGLIIGLAIGACGVYLAIDRLFPGGRAQTEAVAAEAPLSQEEETEAETAQPADSAAINETAGTEPTAAPEPPPEVTAAVAETSAPKIRKDTVRRGYLIHDIAKKFFGSKDYWVYIYEENKSKIGNPNNMQPGVVLTIPQPEKYGIIPGDAESLKKARQKAGEILAKYPR